jgi:ABC-type branched-subunit amino acid transport system substrate-binding protein
MILVLNRLLPLSGSKNGAFFLFIFLFVFSACKTTSVANGTEIVHPVVVDPTIPHPKEEKVEKEDIPIEVVEEKEDKEVKEDKKDKDDDEKEQPTKVDKMVETEIPVGKKDYNVGLILPFTLWSYEYDLEKDTFSFEFSRATETAIEFYQGFKMGLDELKNSSIELDIYVSDDQNSTKRIQNLIDDSSLLDMDLLIGPVFNSNLRVVAEYCKTNKIPIISPLSSSSDITTNNPYYYSANGTEIAHLEALLKHIHQNFPDKTLKILHNNTPHELKVITSIENIINSQYKKNPIQLDTIAITTKSKSESIKYRLDSLQNNIILIPSSQEIFTSFALNFLIELYKKHPMTVYGMPAWRNFSKLNYDYLERLNVHLSSAYWVNDTQAEASKFLEKFTTRYEMPPTEYAYQGYDLAHFVVAYLSKTVNSKKTKERFLSLEEPSKGLQTSYDFIPRRNFETDLIEYWDNQFIHILKFENYAFKKVK